MKVNSTTICRTAGWSLMLLAPLAILRSGHCWAEDVVIVLSGKDASLRSKRIGEIVDYTGESLQLKAASGRVESIPAARVVEIKTEWTAAQQRGDALRSEGKLAEAITAYKQAKRDETRSWARRMT